MIYKVVNNIKQVDTLIKYLVDSLQSYESGHENALHPVALEMEQVFMGEHVAFKPATCGDVQQVHAFIDHRLKTFMSDFTLLKGVGTDQAGRPIEHPAPPCLSFQQPPSSIHSQLDKQVPIPPMVPETPSQPLPQFQALPIHGVFISDLGRQPGAWRRAVKQWEEVDPAMGCALKDWPLEWYTGDMRTITGSKRSQRQTIFNEYERYTPAFMATTCLTHNSGKKVGTQ
jgi:hypothetical protein